MSDSTNLDGKAFTMPGPMKITDPERTPLRGDLAHIALAGRYFVPHYAVPLARRIVAGGAALLASARCDAETLAELSEGSAFDVLDIAGTTAWGQCGEGGLVGYVRLAQLEDIA